jgi:arylsulfatase
MFDLFLEQIVGRRFEMTTSDLKYSLMILVCSMAFASQAVAGQNQEQEPERPNIILIMVDDMGYSDPGFIGGDIDTPNIDSLAREGVVFEQFYNNAKCSQTRASLLSGLYYQQARKAGPNGNLGHDQLAQRNNTTIAEVLKSTGYTTALAGKWHLSGTPYEGGFERFYGFLNGANSHWDSSMVFGDYESNADSFYSSDAFTNAGLTFIEEGTRAGKPVFLYLAYSAPHYPLHAHEQDIERYKGRFSGGWDAVRERRIEHMKNSGLITDSFAVSDRLTDHQGWDQAQANWIWDSFPTEEQADQERLMEVYAAMVDRLDWNIGRLLEKLRELDVDQNTAIFFLSDNGGSPYPNKNEPGTTPGPVDSYRTLNTPWAEVNSTPFKLFKRFSHEGGISTAMIARWPRGLTEPGRRNRDPYHVIDFMPTVIDLADASYPDTRHGDDLLPMAGMSFAPALTSAQAVEPRKLFWEFQENYAMREGRWKLVQSNLGKQWELYDIAEDRGETRNLIREHPDIAEKMQLEWQAWFEAVSANRAVTP